jgi:hypothetical protein
MIPQKPRRNFMSAAFASIVAFVFAKDAHGGAGDDAPRDPTLVRTHMKKGDPPSQPLDTMLLFERGDDTDTPGTREVLSLIHQEKAKQSYPWTLYTSLETHHETGDACVHCARLHKRGPGWSAGLHSEVFNHARGVALGVNIEMSSDYVGAEDTHLIGLNIQAVSSPPPPLSHPMQYAIHIHDKQNAGAHFETAIGINGKGKTGIDLAGDYQIGLHAHHNNIRLAEGACIELDDQGEVKIRYHNGKIEFLRGEKRVASIDMSGEDHAL